ncbi:MAG: hypothetical protein VW971_06595 [Cryomorphaceae bacterium]
MFALVVSGLSLIIGGKSLVLGDAELSYYSPSELFGPFWKGTDSVTVEVKENKALDALINEGDSLEEPFIDSVSNTVVPPTNLVVEAAASRDTTIQVSDVLTFAPFFDALTDLRASSTENVRVLHFGDSQLEGDRITMQLRDAYQRRYGGTCELVLHG